MRKFKEVSTGSVTNEGEAGYELHRVAESDDSSVLTLAENVATGCFEITTESPDSHHVSEFRTREEADAEFEKYITEDLTA